MPPKVPVGTAWPSPLRRAGQNHTSLLLKHVETTISLQKILSDLSDLVKPYIDTALTNPCEEGLALHEVLGVTAWLFTQCSSSA